MKLTSNPARNSKAKKIALAIGAFSLIMIVSCSKDGGLWYSHKWEDLHPKGCTDTDTSGVVSYSATIAPIIQTHCSLTDNACHSNSSHGSSGGDLTTWTNVSSWCTGTPGSTVIEGDLYWKTNPMPKGEAKLSACELATISRWIRQGAQNN